MSAVLKFVGENEIVSYNPANGAEIGRVAETSDANVKIAVAKSREAFQTWRTSSFAARKKFDNAGA